jgi:hypothetical protein
MLKTMLGVAALLLASSVNAALIGAEVNLSGYFYDDLNDLDADGGDVIVSNDLEYAEGFLPTYSQYWSADITDTQLFLNKSTQGYFVETPYFNGFILEIISGPKIVSATVDASSLFGPIDISIEENGSRLLLNFSGVEHDLPGSSIINISTVPLPPAIWLFSSCFGVFAYLRIKKAE